MLVIFLMNRAYFGFLPCIKEFKKADTIFKNHREWFHHDVTLITWIVMSSWPCALLISRFLIVIIILSSLSLIFIIIEYYHHWVWFELNFCISIIDLVIRNNTWEAKSIVKNICFYFKIRIRQLFTEISGISGTFPFLWLNWTLRKQSIFLCEKNISNWERLLQKHYKYFSLYPKGVL